MRSTSRCRRIGVRSESSIPSVVFLLFSLLLLASSQVVVTSSGTPSSLPASAIISDYVMTANTAVLPEVSELEMTWLTFRDNEAPNLQLDLPFSFPYWGIPQNAVYLSPNGAVQFDDTLPCCTACAAAPQGQCCFFMDYDQLVSTPAGTVSTCSFAVNYYNLLAVSLTDLAPATAGAEVGYGYSADAWIRTGNASYEWNVESPFIIQYRGIPLAISDGYPGPGDPSLLDPTGVNFTFGVGLYPSGRIDFFYWTISDPEEYGEWGGLLRLWLVGLRQGPEQSQTDTYAYEYIDPNTGTMPSNGTYIDRRLVINGSTFTFWPIGSQSCSAPPYALPQGNTTVTIVLKDYNNSTGAFTWWCKFVNETSGGSISQVPALYNAENDQLSCLTPKSTLGSTVNLFLLADGVELPIPSTVLSYVSDTSPFTAEILADPDSYIFLSAFCAICGGFRPSFCWYDCAGTLHGTAVIDSCGTCVGGTTGMVYNGALDCLGICYGSFAWVDGECICPDSVWCTNLAREVIYLPDTPSQYIVSINDSVLVGNVSDPIIDFNDRRFEFLPNFGVTSGPLPLFLPFAFPFFSNSYQLVYVSPMGAIYITLPSQACLAHASILLYDGLNDCSFNLIAGYLAEYDDEVFTQSEYSFLSTGEVFTMRYSGLHLAASPPTSPLVSFTISLYPSGRILLQYESVLPPDQISLVPGLPYSRQVLVGAVTYPRPSSDLLDIFPSPFISSSIAANGVFALLVENEWRSTKVSTGVFPPKAQVPAVGSIDFIPFGVNLCLAPFFGSSNGGQLLHINPSLNSPYLPYLKLSCAVSNEFVPAVYNPEFGSFDCSMPLADPGATVVVGLSSGPPVIISTNRIYYTYYEPNSPFLAPESYSEYYTTAALCNQCYSSQLFINTLYCYLDCADEWRGGAYRDDCGSCVGGLTGIPPNAAKDCYGTCFGRYTLQVVHNESQCLCILYEGLGPIVSGCYNVPVMDPTPSVYTQYIDSFAPSASSDPFIVGGANASIVLSSLPSAGLTSIDLPFSFPFYSAQYRQLFIDVDGAVYLTNTSAECLANGSATLFAGNNSATNTSCLHMLIAAALTDYAAYQSFPSMTSYALHADYVELAYEEGDQRFLLSLAVDGGVDIVYDGVVDNGGEWLVGVRFGIPTLLMPFPFFPTAASYPNNCGAFECSYASLPTSHITPTEKAFLPSTEFTSGYYPVRSLFASATSGTLTFCPLSIYICLTPTQGPSAGHTLLTLYNSVTACSSSSCCALRLNMTCNIGGIRLPAWYDIVVGGWRCYSPPGVSNTMVNMWLEESGRQIGMTMPLFFTYNDSSVAPVTDTDVALMSCLDCAFSLPSYCWQDCTGTYRGNATIDECGLCEPPTNTTAVSMAAFVITTKSQPYQSALDCEGVCYGPFSLYDSVVPIIPNAPQPQCGCSVIPEPTPLQRLSFPYTTLCAVWQRLNGDSELLSTLNPLSSYQIFVFVLCLLVLVVAVWLEGVKGWEYLRRRMKMTPAERDRERRRRERRRQRERERRERHRRIALGLPLPNQQVLPPGVAAIPVPLPDGLNAAAPQQQPQQPLDAAHHGGVVAPPATVSSGADALRGGAGAMSASERSALEQLHTMGFNDDAALLPLVRRHRGDVNSVINHLLR